MIKLIMLWIVVLCSLAQARWKPEYAQNDPETRAWYERQQTTPEFRKRNNVDWYRYCCDHSDTVTAKFGKHDGAWYYQLPGETTWNKLPADVVQEGIDTPNSKPVLFVDATGHGLGPVCFFPGNAGV